MLREARKQLENRPQVQEFLNEELAKFKVEIGAPPKKQNESVEYLNRPPLPRMARNETPEQTRHSAYGRVVAHVGKHR